MKKTTDLVPIKKSDNVFVQANEFIKAKYKDNMSFWELVIFGKMCTMIDPNDTDFKDYKIYIKDLIDFTGVVKGGIVYQYVLEATERLKQREISITLKNEEGKEETLDTYLVVGRKVLTHREADENMYVKLTFHPDLKPFLLQLKRDFTKLDIRTYKFLHTSTSIRLYHILKQFYGRRNYKPRIELQELKDMLGVGDKYNPYNNFKQRVLDDAQKRLSNNTDIRFEYDEIKDRKKVVGLVFHILENEPKWMQTTLTVTEQTTLAEYVIDKSEPLSFLDELYLKVEKWNISKEVLSLLIETQPEEAIRNGLEYTLYEEKSGRIKTNIAGFLINAIKNRYTSKAYEEEKNKTFKVQKAKEKTENLNQIKSDLKKLRAEYQEAINEHVRLLTASDESVTAKAIEAVKINNSTYFSLKGVLPNDLAIEDYRQDKILRGLVIQEIKNQHAPIFKNIDESFGLQIKDLERAIKEAAK
jgi:plasmid replication initiation protein